SAEDRQKAGRDLRAWSLRAAALQQPDHRWRADVEERLDHLELPAVTFRSVNLLVEFLDRSPVRLIQDLLNALVRTLQRGAELLEEELLHFVPLVHGRVQRRPGVFANRLRQQLELLIQQALLVRAADPRQLLL